MPDMSQLAHCPQPNNNPPPSRGHVPGSPSRPHAASLSRGRPLQDSSHESPATASNSTSNDTDRVFTPPESDSESNHRHGNSNSSSQESQLMQLSNLAALQQKIVVSREDVDVHGAAQSRKRMADGIVKHTRHHSSASPVRMGHSRNTSTVSVASTTSSRIGELSAELKAKLSYAMVKVNNGWQSHSIDEVESLASQAASPTSSTSTLHGRHDSSASPRITLASFRQTGSNPSSMVTTPIIQQPQARTYDFAWREGVSKVSNSTSPIPTLAPPAPIQPRQSFTANPRRNSNAIYTPAYLAHSHHSSPHTPSHPSPLQTTPGQPFPRTPNVDPILFSPPHNAREQEALETLLFMSSPGNSANLKHTFASPQAAQPRNGARTTLPTSRLGQTGGEMASPGRRALPTGRLETPHSKRVEFETSASASVGMDLDEQYGSPHTRAMPRRKTVNGLVPRPTLSIPAGLGAPARSKPPLGDDDIQRMIDRAAAADSSDSEGEIQLPPDGRRNGTGVGV
ncbi:hypothetical protein F4777DRAFT_458548 [Nemania sp. FL0916]|nr:hypothetical protein F4777DRAFT_458548 [Nemania sp. FL0916]